MEAIQYEKNDLCCLLHQAVGRLYLTTEVKNSNLALSMEKVESEKDISLRKQIQETLDYMAFSLRKDASVTGTVYVRTVDSF